MFHCPSSGCLNQTWTETKSLSEQTRVYIIITFKNTTARRLYLDTNTLITGAYHQKGLFLKTRLPLGGNVTREQTKEKYVHTFSSLVSCHNKGALIFDKAGGVSCSYFIMNSNTPEYFMFLLWGVFLDVLRQCFSNCGLRCVEWIADCNQLNRSP